MKVEDFFRRIDFAVLDRTSEQYNFKEFNRNFKAFYREEKKRKKKELRKEKERKK